LKLEISYRNFILKIVALWQILAQLLQNFCQFMMPLLCNVSIICLLEKIIRMFVNYYYIKLNDYRNKKYENIEATWGDRKNLFKKSTPSFY